MKNIVLSGIVTGLLLSCSSIKQPVASLPLVSSDVLDHSSVVDSPLNKALSTSKVGDVLFMMDSQVQMGDRFFAASGKQCRKLTYGGDEKQIYCQTNQGNWFKVKRVISEYTEADIPEAGL
jgi:hypothetical protein